MKILKFSLCLLLLFSFFSCEQTEEATTGTIKGTVIDAATSEVIKGVSVSVTDLEITTTTDSQGEFAFYDLSPSSYCLEFTYYNYNTETCYVSVSAGKTSENTVGMTEIERYQVFFVDDYYSFGKDGGNFEIGYMSNIDFDVHIDSDVDWLSFEIIDNTDSDDFVYGTVMLYASANETGAEKSATVTFASESYPEFDRTINVTLLAEQVLRVEGETKLDFDYLGGSGTVGITSNIDFSVEVPTDASWLTYTLNDDQLTLTAAENGDNETKTATVKVVADDYPSLYFDITVTLGNKKIADLDRAVVSFTSAGGSDVVNITANVDYTIEIPSDASWLTKSLIDNVLTLTASENTTGSDLSATVTLTVTDYPDLSKEITVTQEMNEVLETTATALYSNVSVDGGNFVISIDHNSDVSVESMPSWVSQVSTKSISTTEFSFKAESCSDSYRLGDIVFKDSKSNTLTYKVGQGNIIYNEAGETSDILATSISEVFGDNTAGEMIKFAGTYNQAELYYIAAKGFGEIDLSETTITGEIKVSSDTYVDGNALPYWFCYGGVLYGTHLSSDLTKITLPENIEVIGDRALYICKSLTELTIPSSVKKINERAFSGCTAIAGTLTLPEGLEFVGEEAFGSCTSLTGSLVIPDGVTLSSSSFSNCTGITGTLTLPADLYDIPASCFWKCNFKGALTIPSTVKTIGDKAFYSCDSFIGDLVLPDNLESIGEEAFYDCNSLTGSITLPNTLVSIGDKGFAYCSGLTGSINIPSSMKSIGVSSFIDCTSLTGSLTISEGIEEIGDYAFYKSSFTGELKIPTTVKTIGEYVFYSCDGFTGELTIPNNVTTIGEYAFRSCSGFTSLTLSENLSSLGEYAFYSCENLAGELKLPETLTDIPKMAFAHCESLTGTLTIPTSVKSIGESAFFECTGFDALKLQDGLESIGAYAFRYCTGFANELYLPSTLKAISGYSFNGCVNITGSITIPSGVTSLNSYTFTNCNNLTGTLTLHKDVTYLGVGSVSAYYITYDQGYSYIDKIIVNYDSLENLRTITTETFPGDFLVGKEKYIYVPKGTLDLYKNYGWENYNIAEQ